MPQCRAESPPGGDLIDIFQLKILLSKIIKSEKGIMLGREEDGVHERSKMLPISTRSWQ